MRQQKCGGNILKKPGFVDLNTMKEKINNAKKT